jgi:CubicO group peptidase (beta-lactamase class C family)
MRKITFIAAAALLLAACSMQERYKYSGDLAIGKIVEGVLETETPDTFFLNLEADTYLYGVAEQVSVDVVVTLYDSAGNVLGLADGPAEGPEMFYFETGDSGRYMLEVAPFEDDSGEYTIELKVVERIATEPEKRADQLFIPFSGDTVPGGVVGVIQDGELIFAKAYGMADLTYGIPFKLSTPSNIGSVSKQFTAFGILLLQKRGKLSLDDDVREYIPELPDFGQVIRIENLLNHTSGLREVYNLMPLTGWKGEDVLRREEVIEMLERQEKLQASPGEEFNYNNSGFILLADIVERITKEDFPGWMAENVFGPLGMASTTVRADPATIIPGASMGYVMASGGYKEGGDLYASYGAGGIYTTVHDLARWLGNFSDPKVGGAEVMQRLVTPDTLNNGDTMTYALGIGVGEYRGLKLYSHGGADNAHRAMLYYFPEIKSGVAVLSNNSLFASGYMANSIADVFFRDKLAPEEKKEAKSDSAGVVVPERLLKAYEGKYKLAAIGMVFKYTLQDGKLIFSAEGQPELEMIPQSDSVFKYKGVEATVKFRLDSKGKVVNAIHYQGGQQLELLPVAPYEPSPEELEAYGGKYYSDELETFYTLQVKDSTLTLHIRNTKDIKLTPVEKDSFRGDVYFIGTMEFQRDDQGNVTGFTVSNGRTRGIRFERIFTGQR